MELYLIRHAQSINNARPEYERVEDPGLTELGHEQAKQLAQTVDAWQLTRLFVSPFLRTLQTADHLQQALSIVPHVRVDLHEQGGCYAGHPGLHIDGRPGMNGEQILQSFPAFALHDDIPDVGWWRGRPYESEGDARLRATALLAWTKSEFGDSDERIAFVTHADFKRCFLDECRAQVWETPFNSSVTQLKVSAREVQLLSYNRIDHLPDRLVSS